MRDLAEYLLGLGTRCRSSRRSTSPTPPTCRRTSCRPAAPCPSRTTARSPGWPSAAVAGPHPPLAAGGPLRRAAPARADRPVGVDARAVRRPAARWSRRSTPPTPRSRALQVFGTVLQPGMEKLTGRIAVSPAARRVIMEHLGGDAVLVPNGVSVARFAGAAPAARPRPRRADRGLPRSASTRPRKGLAVLFEALPELVRRVPACGCSSPARATSTQVRASVPAGLRDRVELLGLVASEDKARVYASGTVYCAPNTHGESFGIVLLEAMATGTPVVASDLEAFRRVLEDGRSGVLFPVRDAAALAGALADLLADARATGPARRAGPRGGAGVRLVGRHPAGRRPLRDGRGRRPRSPSTTSRSATRTRRPRPPTPTTPTRAPCAGCSPSSPAAAAREPPPGGAARARPRPARGVHQLDRRPAGPAARPGRRRLGRARRRAGAARGRRPRGGAAPAAPGAQTAALERAAGAALAGGPVGREAVENDLAAALRAALPLLPDAGSEAVRQELASAAGRVALARAVHNGAVADTLVLRVRRMPRVLHLAGHRVLPRHFDVDLEPRGRRR